MRQNTAAICREQKHPLRFQTKLISPTLTATQVTVVVATLALVSCLSTTTLFGCGGVSSPSGDKNRAAGAMGYGGASIDGNSTAIGNTAGGGGLSGMSGVVGGAGFSAMGGAPGQGGGSVAGVTGGSANFGGAGSSAGSAVCCDNRPDCNAGDPQIPSSSACPAGLTCYSRTECCSTVSSAATAAAAGAAVVVRNYMGALFDPGQVYGRSPCCKQVFASLAKCSTSSIPSLIRRVTWRTIRTPTTSWPSSSSTVVANYPRSLVVPR
jgi:hypothetical protein